MRIEDLTAYEVIEKREIQDLKSTSYIVKHKKTGARIALLSNEDKNKVFYIGFRTPPEDSTGVAHIIEHTVLCGSKEFPVKDPFVELAKGSLNTFLNAMTYPDKTVYPVASCNEQDFKNLMHVYLDAVFYPNIYNEKKIFLQEGWHYELEKPEDELKINGVVYNEMKGAFSSSDDVFEREIMRSLYPDMTYGVESGGDPDVIPELTYEQFLEFHKRYYHPSNSYIYLYGDMDMAERLTWIDEQYLSKYDSLFVDSVIRPQSPFAQVKEVTKPYPISEDESLEENTHLSYNVVIEDSLNPDYYMAFQLLDYAICSAPGTPLKQALIDKGIGKDVYSIYENGIAQPYFSFVAKGCEESDRTLFIQTIEEELQKLVKNGIDKRALEAALNYYEFKYREADFDSYPKGLMYGLQVLDSWLYDDRKPFIHIEANDTFRRLREKLATDYYEQLIQKYILDNPHKSIVMVVPKQGLAQEKEMQLAQKLQAYKESLSQEEVEAIVEQSKALKAYQEEESSEEDLLKIPLLKRSDMTRKAEPIVNEERSEAGLPVLYHKIFTNGINYIRLMFDLTKLPAELLPYLGIFKSVLGLIDTEHYSYGELFNEINTHTGGIVTVVNNYQDSKDISQYKLVLEMKAKTFQNKTGKAVELMEEMMIRSKFDDSKRLLEIISENKSRMQSYMSSAGHNVAAVRTLAYLSEFAMVNETLHGIPYFRLLEDLEAHFEERKDELITSLKTLAKLIFTTDHLMVDLTGEEDGYEILKPYITTLKNSLPEQSDMKTRLRLQPTKKNEGFTNSAQIQYVCRGGNFVTHGLKYTGALKVLKVIMGYDYLWNKVRVQGGAYGCMSSFARSGNAYFVSYRDPNLTKTIEAYEKAAEYIRTMKADERTITKFIIGAISEMDTPMNPATQGARSLSLYMSNLTYEEIQRERDELLDVTEEVIHGLGDYIDAFLSDECICVVGNEDMIKKNSDYFYHVESLFH